MNCKVCNSSDLIKLPTYKHFWYKCNACNSVERVKKDTYFFDKLFPKSLANKLPSYFCYILSDRFFDKSKLPTSYNYYADMGNTGEALGTKWEGETKLILEKFKKYNIDITGKDIMDVSGGPGFVANNLKPIANYILLTEYSANAVEGMQKFLSIDVKKYDYNSDEIKTISDIKFDYVFVRFSINFCYNLEKFAEDVKSILKPDGVVYIEHVEPNKGCILRWQFDDYTYNVLHDVKMFAKIFQSVGYSTLKQEVLFTEPYNKPYWNYPNFKVKLFYKFINFIKSIYKIKIGNKINPELDQVSWVSIFKNIN